MNGSNAIKPLVTTHCHLPDAPLAPIKGELHRSEHLAPFPLSLELFPPFLRSRADFELLQLFATAALPGVPQ
jgi:hypothetical protein